MLYMLQGIESYKKDSKYIAEWHYMPTNFLKFPNQYEQDIAE